MKQVKIADATLCKEGSTFSFKEKIEIARQLEKLNVDIIELPEISNKRVDTLFVRTVSSFVKNSVLSVAAGSSMESIEDAASALSGAEHPLIRIELPVSPVGMEYTCHKKPPVMLQWINALITAAGEKCAEVEFCAVDATRAEPEFLISAIKTAVEAGATSISLCDSADGMLPDEFAAFIDGIASELSVPVGVSCDDKNGLAVASAVLAVRSSADFDKTDIGGNGISLEIFADLIKNCGVSFDLSSSIKYTELHRIVKQIMWITENASNQKSAVAVAEADNSGIHLDVNDSQLTVIAAVNALGYDLSEEDSARVYEEFRRVAEKKNVGAKELDAIVAAVALQVPATYKLENYVVNSGNIITASAQITLLKGETVMQGISMGDGPIDAAFLAVEQIIGHHYELDDFQIQSVTEGKEAMGQAIVKLRNDGKLYSGNGISTDIIGASIRAYINAVNKIVYEEA